MRIIRLLALLIWLFISLILGTIYCVFRWGNPNNMHDVLRPLSRVALWILGIQVIFEGGEETYDRARPAVYIGNHQHGLDVITHGMRHPRNCIGIGKKEILWIPVFGLFFFAAGNVLINRKKREDAVAGLNKAAQAIREKNASIGLYPEGTRNRKMDGLLPFKKGAFYLAVEAQVPLIPMVTCSLKAVTDGKGRLKPGTIIIRPLSEIPTQGLTKESIPELMTRARAQMLDAYTELNQKLGIRV